MKIASGFQRFGHGFGPHFRWFWDAFPVRAFTSHRTSRTLFLNNTTVFCAQNQVFDLPEKLEFQCFSLSFSIPVLALNFNEVLHWFWLNRGSFFSFFPCFSTIEFSMNFRWQFKWNFNKNGSQKWRIWITRITRARPFSLPFRSRSAGRVFEGSLAHCGTILAPLGSFLASFSAKFPINVA